MAERLLHKQSSSHDMEAEGFCRYTASKLHLEEAGASVVRKVVNKDTGLDNKSPRCYEWKYHLQVWRLPERPPMSSVEEARAGIRGMTIGPSRNEVNPIMFKGKLPTPEPSPHGHRFEHFVQPNNEKNDFTKANIACGLTLLEKENLVSKEEEKKEIGETSPSNVTSNEDYASIDNCNDSGCSRVTIDNGKEVEENPMENSKSSDRTGKVTCQTPGETQKRAENHQSLGLDLGYQGGALADERLGYDTDDKRDDSLSNDAGSEDPGVFQEVNGSMEFVDDEGHLESEYYVEENNENDWYPGYYKVYQETTPNTYDQETLYWYDDDEYERNSEYDDLDQYYYRPEYYNDKEVYGEIENFDRTDGHHGSKNYADSVFCDANGYGEPQERNHYEEGPEDKKN